MSDVVLYVEPNWISPYVFACFVTLVEKRVEFSTVVLDSSAGQTRASDYLDRTVTGRVPSLTHGDFGLAESSAIVEYLEEQFPSPRVLPSSIAERARARQLMSWLRSDDTAPIRDQRPSTTIFYEPPKAPLDTVAERAATKLVAVAQRLLGDHPSLFDDWCIVDAELAFMLMRLIAASDPVDARVRAYAEVQWARPSVQAFVRRDRPALAR
jgi:glutathione S-transferase